MLPVGFEGTLSINKLVLGVISESTSSASKLLPKLDLNFTAQNAWAPNTFFDEYENYKVELSLNIPLYNGGYNYSDVRQKKKNAILFLKFLSSKRTKEKLKKFGYVFD